ncbi:class I SAM-dependent methyltransferase [Persicobacter sp. CCB-QB2]|uniref:class I SAM-dependent methyltransferase n=1 Tax=Persicobacter sp. CCB-QB2 TaxID=1561025 RepID=UPI0006A98FCD|nr:class I SAM-dependent methyltransferase [Persicobacter sp. CCB-QB2]
MSIIKKILRTNRFSAAALNIYFLNRFYLKPKGWTESRFLGQSINGEGDPIPWFTYPMIHFLSNRITKEHRVFEFGMGNSTRWFAARAKEVVAVDHDKGYFNFISPKLEQLPNVKCALREDVREGYPNYLSGQEEDFDIIVVDGRNRNKCAEKALKSLSARGVIIWDNAEREEYQKGIDHLHEAGFKQLDFSGHAPINFQECVTAIFYRANNCLDI